MTQPVARAAPDTLDPAVYARAEALLGPNLVDQARSSFLLIQMGALDENVPPGQVLQFVDALTKANKDFEFLYLPSRDHQFIGDAYVMRRDWDFMVRNLLGREPPAGYRISMDHR
jgi:dipeptidyl-peptidase-4